MSEGETLARQLRAIAADPPAYPDDRFAGRGIVMCAGGPRLLTCAWVTLSLLRRTLGCELPVQLWHLGPRELGAHEAALFAELDVETVDALEVRRRHPARTLGGWELKPYAIAHSRFREVLLLDADNAPVVDPSGLFDLEPYRATGAVFWPDIVRLGAGNGLWDLCGVPYRNEPSWESGQIVLDKRRCWTALHVALHMNMHSDAVYEHSHGDKDTYHLAWRLLDQPVAMTPYPARSCVTGIVQRDFEGRTLFQHRTLAKWLLRGDNLLDDGFLWQDDCLGYLDELRARWTGRIEEPPAADGQAADLAAELGATRWFRYERAGHDARDLELLSGHRIGAGRTATEMRWHVDGDALVLGGNDGETCRLRRGGGGDGGVSGDGDGGAVSSDGDGGVPDGVRSDDGDGDDGVWRGRWTRRPHHEVELRPVVEEDSGALGDLVRRVLDRVAGGSLPVAGALDCLATIAETIDLRDVMQAERRRWAGDSVVAPLLARLHRQAGLADPSLRPGGPDAGQGYDPV